MNAALSLVDVQFSWSGSKPAVHALSGVVEQGSWLALIGPNGAGKSTLLRLMAGLSKPDSGSIGISGRPLSSYSDSERSSLVAFVPQVWAQGFDLTVRSIVELGRIGRYRWWDRIGRLSSAHRQAADLAMAATGTYELAERRFTELSGGESKRVLLAMALAQETPILLLDEPTAYLDPGHANDLLNRVQNLVRQEGKTVIMAYHDLTTVGLYCDQIWALNQGQLVLSGPALEVLSDPALKSLFELDFLTLDHPIRKRPMLLFP